MKFRHLDSIPWVLKIVSFALIGVGMLQWASLFEPSYGPGIDGRALMSPYLISLIGLFHIALGLAILTAMKSFVIPSLLFLPAIQYGFLFLEYGAPGADALLKQVVFSSAWCGFFVCYFFFTNARTYFSELEVE